MEKEERVPFDVWRLLDAIEDAIVGVKFVEQKAKETGKSVIENSATIALYQLESLQKKVKNES